MNDKPISELEDKDLQELVGEGNYLDKLLGGHGGDILRSATKRIIERYERKFAMAEGIPTQEEAMEYKIALRFYKYNLFEAFKHLIDDGEIAQKEIDFRNNNGEPTSEQGDEQDS